MLPEQLGVSTQLRSWSSQKTTEDEEDLPWPGVIVLKETSVSAACWTQTHRTELPGGQASTQLDCSLPLLQGPELQDNIIGYY